MSHSDHHLSEDELALRALGELVVTRSNRSPVHVSTLLSGVRRVRHSRQHRTLH